MQHTRNEARVDGEGDWESWETVSVHHADDVKAKVVINSGRTRSRVFPSSHHSWSYSPVITRRTQSFLLGHPPTHQHGRQVCTASKQQPLVLNHWRHTHAHTDGTTQTHTDTHRNTQTHFGTFRWQGDGILRPQRKSRPD